MGVSYESSRKKPEAGEAQALCPLPQGNYSRQPLPRFTKYRASLSTGLNHGRRNVSQLFCREGYALVEEVWRV